MNQDNSYHLTLTSAGAEIQISAKPIYLDAIKENDFLFQYVPDLEIAKEATQSTSKLELVEKDDTNFMIREDNQFVLNFNPKWTSIKDIISIIDYCFDKIRQGLGVYNIHSSACCKNNRTVLLMGGASGLGKTSVCFNLCLEDNYQFVSDEKTLIKENMEVVGGVKRVKLSKRHLEENFPKELHDFDNSSNAIKFWEGDSTLGLIVQPIVVPQGKLIVNKWDILKSDWHLYEEMTRKIRGVSRRINNFELPVISLDSEDISKKRSKFAKVLASKVDCYDIYGDLKSVSSKINELMNSNEK
jgi:hypothetical protein